MADPDVCRCGMPEAERCVECGSCECPDNLRTCPAEVGCISQEGYDQWLAERS